MVLSEGHLIYFGDVSGVESWFVSRLNYPRPASTSVSDYILDLVNVGFVKRDLITERTINSRAELQAAAKAFQHSSAYKLNIPDVRCDVDPPCRGQLRHLMAYHRRTLSERHACILTACAWTIANGPGSSLRLARVWRAPASTMTTAA